MDQRIGELGEIDNRYREHQDPNFSFLHSTLVYTNRRNIRDCVSYFTVRAWRKELKPLQISAVRNLKAHPTSAALDAIAEEIAGCALAITNGSPYEFVCSVPPGTCKKENFATHIGRAVAREMNVEFSPVLHTASYGRGRSSHPQKSLQFRARFEGELPQGKIGLLVDDVATTGTHFAQCVEQFRKLGISVVCVSWIG